MSARKLINKFQLIENIISNDNFQTKIEKILELEEIPDNLKIEFVLYCARDCNKYINSNKYPDLKEKANICIELVADYLLEKNVSEKDLNVAASSVVAAVKIEVEFLTSYAALAAAYAAYAAHNFGRASAVVNAASYAANNDPNVKEKYFIYLLKLVFKYFDIDEKIITFLYL